jgi:hypothetical protein
MRRFLIATAALLSLAAPAVAVPACSNPADQSAWEVLALRRMMSVIATKNCGKEREYNEYFIKRFQPIIQDNDRKVQAYFRRVYGGAGRGRMDIFETELANIMSQQANRQAGEFCSRASLMFNEMLALPKQDDLAAYAAVKDLPPPNVSMCPTVRR